MNYIDALISIVQSILYIYIINYCIGTKIIKDNKKSIMSVTILSIIAYIIPSILGNFSICVFFIHIICVVVIYLFFNKQYIEALTSYSIIYSIVALWIFIFANILYGVIQNNIPTEYITIVQVLFLYISQVILYILCLKNIEKIKQIYKLVLLEKYSIKFTFIISFLTDFLISFYLISYNMDNPIYRDIIVIVFFVLLGVSIYSVNKIAKKSIYINKLNETLITKNDKLKNIKNDYGLQMLCLYELCDMEKFDDVSSLLKSIISENSSNIAEKSINKSSLLSLATKHLIHDDIKIVIKDNANFKLAEISEIELYRVIVNIINNAIKAMKNKGTIIAKSYEDLNNVIITIENDGEKIPKEIIDKIFDSGFTTKEDYDRNHGYGLSIVKELIENHKGKIFVESNEAITKFTIVLPIKEAI